MKLDYFQVQSIGKLIIFNILLITTPNNFIS
jgi:hypothetical protein